MKKFSNMLIIASAILFQFVFTKNAQAQTAPQHIITINTQYMLPTDSAGRAERNALMKDYFEKVTMKNQYIIHESTMTHYYTDDSRELVTIDEFASWADVEKASDRFAELEKQAWPDAKQLDAMMKKMDKYVSYHKDGIYHSMTGMSK